MTDDHKCCHAWVSPEGEVHHIVSQGHYAFASALACKMFDGENVIDPIGLLEYLGWIHISYDEIYLTRKPTQAQEEALTDIATEFQWMRAWDELAEPMFTDGRFEQRRFHLVHFAQGGFCGSIPARYEPKLIFPQSQIEAMSTAVA